MIDTPDIRPFMIQIGNTDYLSTSVAHTNWKIYGTLVFKGKVNFCYGTYLLVAPGATLTFHNSTFHALVGTDAKIICFDKIDIGGNVRIPWECQLYDSNFHYVKNKEGNTKKLTKPIVIGDNVWIGNRTTISAGAKIPDYCIVASNSLVNKDLSEYGENCLFAGSPVKVVANNVTRVFSYSEEMELHKKYGYNFVSL